MSRRRRDLPHRVRLRAWDERRRRLMHRLRQRDRSALLRHGAEPLLRRRDEPQLRVVQRDVRLRHDAVIVGR